MKIFKKAAAIFAAAAMAIGSLSVTSHAEDMYKVYVDAPKASVGETVEAKVVIDVGSTAVGGVSFKLNYDPSELKCVSVVLGEEFSALGFTGSFYPDEAKSIIGFAYTTGVSGFCNRNVDLIYVSFKVLKPNAKLTLSDVVVIGDDFDSTKLTGTAEDAVAKCSHKNTETYTTPATCKDDGKDETVCKDCGTVVKTDPIAATGEHSWTEEITKQPTCTENGSKTLTCTVCGEIKPADIPSLGHDWDNGETVIEPTCTEKGEKLFTCNRCGETKPEEVSALGHDWGEWAVTKEATAHEEGEEARECKSCGEKETRAVAKLPEENGGANNYPGGFDGFDIPETTAAVSVSVSAPVSAPVPGESEAVTAAAITTAPAAVVSKTAADTAAAPDTGILSAVSVDSGNGNGSVGNADSENFDDKNSYTGMLIAVFPAALAALGVIVFKKRK